MVPKRLRMLLQDLVDLEDQYFLVVLVDLELQ